MSHQPNAAAAPPPLTTTTTTSASPTATNTATAAKPDFPYRCNICKLEFPTASHLLCHRYLHRNPRASNLVELNPTRPTIRREFRKAGEGRRSPSPLGLRSPVLAPSPIRVAPPAGSDPFGRLWWAVGFTKEDLGSRKPVLKLLSSRGVQIPIFRPYQTRKGTRGDVRGGKGKEVIRSGPKKTISSTTKPDSTYNCNFCRREFHNPYSFSAHYSCHKDLPASQWLEHGPRYSKIRKLISDAVDEFRSLNPPTEAVDQSGPIRDVPQPRMYPRDYPPWDLGPADGSSASGEAVPRTQVHGVFADEGAGSTSLAAGLALKSGVENEGASSPAVRGEDPLPDLNEPYSPGGGDTTNSKSDPRTTLQQHV